MNAAVDPFEAKNDKPIEAINADIAAAPVKNAVLLPGQVRWINDPSPLKVCKKGRRTGITWAEAADDVLIAASRRDAGGFNVYYFPQTCEDSIEYIEACGKWARAFSQVASTVSEKTWEAECGEIFPDDDPDKHIKAYVIRFDSGYRIVALTSAPARARGKQGIFVFDEAAFHARLREVLKAVMATFLRGGKVRVISTQNGDANPFNELAIEIESGRRIGTTHTYAFRTAIAEGMYRRICEMDGREWSQEAEDVYVKTAYGLYGEDAAEELDAIPSQGSGVYLSMALIESRMSADTPLVRGRWNSEFALLPSSMRESEIDAWCKEHLEEPLRALDQELAHGLGEDFGRLGDLTVIPILAEQPNLVKRCRLWVELSNCPFEQQRQILFYIICRLPRFRAGALDATGNGQYLAEVAAQKFGASRIDQVKLSDGYYLENMPRLRAALEDGTLDGLPRDSQIRDDLRSIRLIDGIPKLPKAKTQQADDVKLQRHGDGAVAILLAHAAMRRDVVPIEFTAIGRLRTSLAIADYIGG